MEKVHQIFENLYDVNGYLIIPDPGTFDPATEEGRAELVHFTGYIKEDRFLRRYGVDTVVHLIRLSEDTSTLVPLHVTNLSEPMQAALQRYRHEMGRGLKQINKQINKRIGVCNVQNSR